MSVSVRVSDELYRAASATAKAEFRSIPQQIEFWAQLGRAAFDNPDLPIDLVRDILMSRMVPVANAEPFVPEGQPSTGISSGTSKADARKAIHHSGPQ